MRALVLDCETTGYNPNVNRVIELAITDFNTGETLVHTYFNPEVPIPVDIVALTKITDEMVADAPLFESHAVMIATIIRDSEVVIGYNPMFDRGMISGELRRCGQTTTWPLLICGKRLWDIYEPRDKRDLTNAYRRFVNDAGFDGAHGAMPDTLATAQVVREQLRQFELGDKSWRELDPEQATWWGPSNHVVWRDDVLVLNFGKNKGTPLTAIDRGYWQWIRNQEFPDHVKMVGDYLIDVRKTRPTDEELATWARDRGL